MKAVDAESDEQAARFSTPTISIDPDKDMLLLIGWRWTDLGKDGRIIGEFPYIFAGVILPAAEIARERDVRLEITNGKIEGEKVLVYSERKRNLCLIRVTMENFGVLFIVQDERLKTSMIHYAFSRISLKKLMNIRLGIV